MGSPDEVIEPGGSFVTQLEDVPPAKKAEATPATDELGEVLPTEEMRTPVAQKGKGAKPASPAVETLAKDMGWAPEAEFKGDKAKYVDAKTYIKRGHDIQGNMGKKLKHQTLQLEEMSTTLNDLKVHQDKKATAEINRLTKELEKTKREAVVRGDVDEVEQIDKDLKGLEKEKPEKTKGKEGSTSPVFKAWNKKNAWYGDNKEMTRYADAVGHKYDGAPEDRLFGKVDAAVRDMFPEEFEGEAGDKKTESNRKKAATVEEPGTEKRSKADKWSYSDLNEQQKAVCDRFVKAGTMKREEYINDLGAIGELG